MEELARRLPGYFLELGPDVAQVPRVLRALLEEA
jgi:hypothetical protein